MRIEEVQLTSKKIVDGDLKVFFPLVSLFLIVLSPKMSVHIVGLVVFLLLSIHAARKQFFRIIKPFFLFLIPGTLAVYLTAGLSAAVSTGLRCLASISVLSYLILVTTLPEFLTSLRRLKLPDFVVEISTLIYRAIQILLDEAGRMEIAAKARLGHSSRKALLRTASLLSYSLFLRAMSRADRMSTAMEARCYSGRMPVYNNKSRGWFTAIACVLPIVIAWWF